MFRRSVITLLVLVSLPALASAQARPWIQVSGGYNTFSMKDVNDYLDTGTVDNISNGLSFGGAFGIDLPPAFAIGASYDHLSASTDFVASGGKYELEVPANLLRAFGQYQFVKGPKSVVFGEVGLGMVSTSGTETLTLTGLGSGGVKWEGSGASYDGSLGAEFIMAPQISFVGSLGYRYAKTSELKIDGEVQKMANGDNASMDYTGMSAKLGIKLAFSK
jgi:hypothetical protein